MKVASKSPSQSPSPSQGRATLTLSGETYRKIDLLRGEQSRSAWIQSLVEREDERKEREQLALTLQQQYTPAVTAETLAVNDEFPVHET
jgi:hypothetical protein